MISRSKAATVAGFILYLYQGSTPINHPPWHIYDSAASCEVDRVAFGRLAPEWAGVCKEQQKVFPSR